jgi:hypothetical protein
MVRVDVYKENLLCRQKALIRGIEERGGRFHLGKKLFVEIVGENIIDGLDTGNETFSTRFKFYGGHGGNLFSAFISARRDMAARRIDAVNLYFEHILEELDRFRDVYGSDEVFYVEKSKMGSQLVEAYAEKYESRQFLLDKLERLSACKESNGWME